MTATPWAAMLRTASRMGIAPAAFWRLSLLEWRALSDGDRPAALARDELDRLMREWPDGEA